MSKNQIIEALRLLSFILESSSDKELSVQIAEFCEYIKSEMEENETMHADTVAAAFLHWKERK